MRATSLLAAFTLAVACPAALAQAPAPARPAAPAAPPAAATAPANADPVVARVGRDEIRSSDLSEAAQSLPEELRGMPPNLLYPLLLDQQVDRKILVLAARKAGLPAEPGIQRQIARATDTALQNAFLLRTVGPTLTEEAIRARYDRDFAGKPGEDEVRARHILVADEAAAKSILAEARGSASFEELAKKYSTDPTAQAGGGDLGFFKKTDMLPEFADAAFALQPGQISEPVQTRFGWHIIKVEERRTAPPPPFEQVRDEIRQALIQDGVKRVLDEARTGIVVTRFNPDGSAIVPPAATPPATPPAASAPPNATAPRTPAAPPRPATRTRTRALTATVAALSPLAVPLPALVPLPGVSLGAAEAGIRYQGRTDLVMAELAPGTTVAGVFTRNRCPGAPIDWCRDALTGGQARALVVNAGNANVFTGRAGAEATEATARAAAALVGCRPREVFVASTGVIGQALPADRLIAALPALHASLAPDAWDLAARGIMTTDTFPKAATRVARIGEAEVRITGIAKGSGMVAPDMATMLCFVFTDAAIAAEDLQDMLRRGVKRSFNRTTVDSDTSTSDTVLLFATGQARHPKPEGRKVLRDFREQLADLLLELALQVVRDGEGAQKLVRIDVSGAVTAGSAKRIALAIANSPLVKTAIAGEDANWGRIVMAVGKAGEPADRDRLSVGIGGTWMARHGAVVEGYDEGPVVEHMRGREIAVAVDLGLGDGEGTAWTCDLTHGYIDINGSYRS